MTWVRPLLRTGRKLKDREWWTRVFYVNALQKQRSQPRFGFVQVHQFTWRVQDDHCNGWKKCLNWSWFILCLTSDSLSCVLKAVLSECSSLLLFHFSILPLLSSGVLCWSGVEFPLCQLNPAFVSAKGQVRHRRLCKSGGRCSHTSLTYTDVYSSYRPPKAVPLI